MIFNLRGRYILGSLAPFVLASTLLGQGTTGSIVGHIKDPSGASIVGASVTITETETKDTHTVVTSASGDYAVPFLKPGHYSVMVRASGFKPETQSAITLNVAQISRTDLALAVGESTETEVVSAQTVTLDTDSATIGEVIGGKLMSDLPLNGRNFQDLLLTIPGAVNNGGGEQGTQRIVISGDHNSSIGIGGARGASNGYTMDGSSIIDIGEQSPAFQPSVDDIAEFKVQTKVYSAAYGFNANQITLSSKAGTNTYHGSVFEFLRNNYVDATPHGSTPGVTVAILQQNQFGYYFGGPVIIPKVYNGHDKTFFFANYEGYRQHIAGTGSNLVPDQTQLSGIFTQAQLGTVQGSVARVQCGHTYKPGDPLPLFDPANGCPFPLVNGSYTIPSNRISYLGKLAQRSGLYFPASGPNIPNAPRGQPNYSVNASTNTTYDQQNYRLDQNIGEKDSVFFHATIHNENQLIGDETPVSAVIHIQPARFYTFTETHTFGPSFTNQFRFGYIQATSGYHEEQPITAADLASLNLPSPYQLPIDGYPRIEFAASSQNDGINPHEVSAESPTSHVSTTFDGGDSAFKIIGRHALSFGVQARRNRYRYLVGGGLGYFVFNGQYTGDDVADLLLGSAAGINTVQVGPLASATAGLTGHMHLGSTAAYIQDDWNPTPSLTINAGLRYEYNQTPFEEQGDMFSPDFSAPQGAIYVSNKSIVNNYGGTNPFGAGGLYVQTPGNSTLLGSQKSTFAPRIGFAYRPFSNNKTVVRGGYGVFFDSYEANELGNSSGFYPLSSGVSTPSSTVPLAYPALYNTNNLPAAASSGPVVSEYMANSPATGDTNPNSPLGFIVQIGGAFRQPYVQDWDLGFERELPLHTTLEVDYVANKSTHLFDRQDPNQPVLCNAATNCTVDASGPTVANQDRRPYKNLGSLVNTLFNGYGNYNALDVKVEHRTSDLSLIAAYTWAKQMDVASSVAGLSGDAAGYAGPQDSHNVAGDYARGDFNVGQRLVISGVYSLPVGRGRAVLRNESRFLDEVIGGWQVSAIILFQGGLPFSVTAQDIGGSTGTYGERADLNMAHAPAGFHKSNSSWFSSSQNLTSTHPNAQFTQPVPGLFGNSGRNAVNGPGLEDEDVSLFKDFKLKASSVFQFRFDAFNVFNHYNPGAPDGNITDATAGVIDPNNYQRDARILQAALRLSF